MYYIINLYVNTLTSFEMIQDLTLALFAIRQMSQYVDAILRNFLKYRLNLLN